MSQTNPLVFIAQGIGITPFRSMIKYLLDSDSKHAITLFYIVQSRDEIIFQDVFEEAEKKGFLKIYYIINNSLDEATLKKHVESIRKPIFYISGPQSMVESYSTMLTKLGATDTNIKADLFTGYEQIS